jgi:uncharacterized protein YciI
MKYYIIHITYTVPIEKIEELTPLHREYLKGHYESGTMLFSGPRVPRTGGVLFARAEAETANGDMIAADPYNINGAAAYEVIEMNPVLWTNKFEEVFKK